MAGTSNHNVIITLTGESTGLKKVAASGAQSLAMLNSKIREITVANTTWNASTGRLMGTSTKFVGTVSEAKRVAAQLHAEQERGAKINEMLTASLTKQQLAILRANGLMQGTTGAAGSASFAVLGLTQGIQDMGNFGMGAAQGIRAVTNNIQQVATAFTFAAAQAGSARLALQGMWAALKGPAGVLFAFSAISAAIEFMANASQKGTDKVKELKDALLDFATIKTPESLSVYTLGMLDVADAAGVLAEKAEKARVELEAMVQKRVTDNAREENEKLAKSWTELKGIAEASTAAGDYATNITKAREENKKLAKSWADTDKALEGVVGKWRDFEATQKQLAEARAKTDNDITALFEELGVDGLVAAMGKRTKAVSEFEKGMARANLIAAAGFTKEAGFSFAFDAFLATLKGINKELFITEDQFSKLSKNKETQAFLDKEIEKEQKRKEALQREWERKDKEEGDIILRRIALVIFEMERLNKVSEKFAKLGTLRAKPEGLGIGGAETRRKGIIEGGIITEDGQIRDEALKEFQIAESQLRQLSPIAIKEAEATARAMGDIGLTFSQQIRGWARENGESIAATAQMISGSLGSAGQSFMQLAQTGGEASESLFIAGKAAAMGSAIVNTAAAIVKALEQGGPFLGPAMAVTMAAAGAAQIAVIAGTKFNKSASGASSGGGSTRVGGLVSFGAFGGVTSVADLPAGSALGLTSGGSQGFGMDHRFEIRGRDLISVLDMESGARGRMGARN